MFHLISKPIGCFGSLTGCDSIVHTVKQPRRQLLAFPCLTAKKATVTEY